MWDNDDKAYVCRPYRYGGVNSFDELCKLVLHLEDTQRQASREVRSWLVDMAHRSLTGSPANDHPLVMAFVVPKPVSERFTRWKVYRYILDVQLDDRPSPPDVGDLRVYANLPVSDLPMCSYSSVEDFWEWDRIGHVEWSLDDLKDVMTLFHRNGLVVDVDNHFMRRFLGDTDLSFGVHYWEHQILCPYSADYDGSERFSLGVVVTSFRNRFYYVLTSQGNVIRRSRSRGRFYFRLCPPLVVGDRIGILYRGDQDSLHFVVNGKSFGPSCVQLCKVPGHHLRPPRVYPYLKVNFGPAAFSTQNRRTLATSLKRLCQAAVLSSLLSKYHHLLRSHDDSLMVRPSELLSKKIWCLIDMVYDLPLPQLIKEELQYLLPHDTTIRLL